VALLAVATGGCNARQDFDRQIEICTAGEKNGVLDAAADACGRALTIATENDYAPEEVSALSLRLGRIERQRGRFDAAEVLVRASLDLTAQSGESKEVALHLVELSLSLAGQDRWSEGVTLLDRAEPLVRGLTGRDRGDAANVYAGYARQLRKAGDTQKAAEFEGIGSELLKE
jgi:tetratricopeptide (TPR) repeat protein